MLFKIIKAYWKSRKTNDVIVICPHWNDLFVINTDIIHVEIKMTNTHTMKVLAKYGYIENARVHEGEEI